jgi:hypothetical protein
MNISQYTGEICLKVTIIINPERMSMQDRNGWFVCSKSHWPKNPTNKIAAPSKISESEYSSLKKALGGIHWSVW